MAVIPVPISYVESKTGKNIKEIRETLHKLGFPNEVRDGYIDVEVTPNRLDMHTIEGISRMLNCYFYEETKNYRINKSSEINIIDKGVKQRPIIRGFIAEKIKDKDNLLESILIAQEKIHETYGRKRKKLAIGMHDLKKVKFPVYYEEASNVSFIPLGEEKEMSAEEIITSLEKGKQYGHLIKKPWPVVKDENGIISMPPIINAERTKITEKTNSFFVEITGNDLNAINNCLKVLICAFADRGAKISLANVNGNVEMPEKEKLEFNLKEIKKLTGLNIKRKEAKKLLKKSGITLKKFAIIPIYRIDINDTSDIAEEILINYGYENIIEEKLNLFEIGNAEKNIERDIFLRMGFNETVGFFLISSELQKMFYDEVTTVIDAVSNEHNSLRTSLIFSLLMTEEKNKMKKLPHKIFEIGKVFYGKKERNEIAFLIADDESDINKAISVIKTFSKEIGSDIKAVNHKTWHEKFFVNGRYAYFEFSNYIAIVGEIKPEINEMFNINNPLTAGIIIEKD